MTATEKTYLIYLLDSALLEWTRGKPVQPRCKKKISEIKIQVGLMPISEERMAAQMLTPEQRRRLR